MANRERGNKAQLKFAENVSQQSLAEQMSRIPGVYEVIVISGEWDIALKVRAARWRRSVP